jgi:hypothetical protein
VTRTFALTAVVAVAVLIRLLPHPWNFAPVTAAAVFAGVTFRSGRAAVLVPLAALLASDLIREALFRAGYAQQWGLYTGLWAIYAAVAVVILAARLARGTRSPATLAGVTLGGSCLYFLLSNLAVWAVWDLYPKNLDGLAACFTAAVPFFRTALLGDCFYAVVLFGGWALAEARVPALRPAPAAVGAG